MDSPQAFAEFAIWYVIFLFTLTFHEGAHSLVARFGGDDTAYRSGQVSLNPLPHIRREVFGTVVVPILTFFMSGWMMGWASAPYDPIWARRHPKRHAAMSAAGPGANLLLAIISFVSLRVLLGGGSLVPSSRGGLGHLVEAAPGTPPDSLMHAVAFTLSVALGLNVLLFVFNLIPIPPLDGSGVLQGLLPGRVGRFIESIGSNPMMSLLGLIFAWKAAGYLLYPAFSVVVYFLYHGHQ